MIFQSGGEVSVAIIFIIWGSDFIERIAEKAHDYNGFNLILGEKGALYWYSNLAGEPRYLTPKIYGLSNHLLDTSWPKVVRGKYGLQKLLGEKKHPRPEDFFSILSDKSVADDDSLPDTGIEIEWERILSSIFVSSQVYGTRSTTLILIDLHDHVTFIEKVFDATATHSKTTEIKFQIES